MSTLIRWVLGLLLAAIALKVLVWWLQPRMAFYPRRGATPPPPPFAEFQAATEDGETLHGWMLRPDSSGPVVIYFCGNAGNLSDRTDLLSRFAGTGVTLFAFNYRGMGESSGSPTEQEVYRDASAIYRFVTEAQRVDPKRIILWGHSIGGAVAADLATRKPCAGLILESTFRSGRVMARRMIPLIPTSLFVTYRFDNEEHMKQLRVPILFIHGLADDIIPSDDSQFLYGLASEPKELWLVPQGGHNDLYETAGNAFYNRIEAFSRKVTGR